MRMVHLALNLWLEYFANIILNSSIYLLRAESLTLNRASNPSVLGETVWAWLQIHLSLALGEGNKYLGKGVLHETLTCFKLNELARGGISHTGSSTTCYVSIKYHCKKDTGTWWFILPSPCTISGPDPSTSQAETGRQLKPGPLLASNLGKQAAQFWKPGEFTGWTCLNHGICLPENVPCHCFVYHLDYRRDVRPISGFPSLNYTWIFKNCFFHLPLACSTWACHNRVLWSLYSPHLSCVFL